MDGNAVCENLLSTVRNSGLNFLLSETPFGVTIAIKKTFILKKTSISKIKNIFMKDTKTCFNSPTPNRVNSTQSLSSTLFHIFLYISEHSGESGLRVAGALEWGIFLPGQITVTKEHQIRKNTTKLDDSEHSLEVEYKDSPTDILC